MNIKNLFHDDDAVSPVIGVILMVAITVILAAVIASFVLGLGDSASEVQPNSSFSFDYEEDAGSSGDLLTITLTDGDEIEAGNLYIRGELGSGSDINADFTELDTSSPPPIGDIATGSSDTTGIGGFSIGSNTLSPGQGVQLDSSSSSDFNDYEISIVWETSENSATLEESEGPDA
jgi:flagellin-like protein